VRLEDRGGMEREGTESCVFENGFGNSRVLADKDTEDCVLKQVNKGTEDCVLKQVNKGTEQIDVNNMKAGLTLQEQKLQ
jgi:hypothetical protein